MAKFHRLTVTNLRQTIRGAVVVTLQPQSGDFNFIQGQYLTFRREIDGIELRRSYSICSAPGEADLQVGIKRVEGGAFSTWANDELKIGDILEAMEPMGRFHTPLNETQSKHYLLFAGGSGITPVLSIIKTTLSTEPGSRITLVYANRSVSTIMFREALEDLKSAHMTRLNLIHILENGTDEIALFQGRVDGEKCDELFQALIEIGSVDTAFICGPEPMMQAITSSLKTHGMREADIKYELFLSAQPGRLESKPSHKNNGPKAVKATATLDGTVYDFDVAQGQSLLEAALASNLDAPFACKAGVCSTCKCKLLHGEVEMLTNHALEDYEVERGYILSCQSYPLTETLKVDYDGH